MKVLKYLLYAIVLLLLLLTGSASASNIKNKMKARLSQEGKRAVNLAEYEENHC